MNRQQYAETVAEAYINQYATDGSPVMGDCIIVYDGDGEFLYQSSLTPVYEGEAVVEVLHSDMFGNVDPNDLRTKGWIVEYLTNPASDAIWQGVIATIEREGEYAQKESV